MIQFGLSGQRDDDYDYLLGRKQRRKEARAKRKARRLLRRQQRQDVKVPLPASVENTVENPAPVANAAQSAAPPQVVAAQPETPSSELAESSDEGEESEGYNSFLGLGKKARQRRAEKKAIKQENQRVALEERKAGLERTLAENKILQQTAPAGSDAATAAGTASANAPAPLIDAPVEGEVPPAKSKKTLLIAAAAGGVVLLAIVIAVIMKSRNTQAAYQAAA